MTTPAGPGDVGGESGAAQSDPDARACRVFISYARADAPVAHQVEQIVLQWGCQPWLDQRSLSGGQDWTAALEQAIDTSQALIIILTSAALASSMVRREYERALDRGIPVLLVRAGATGALPPSLTSAPLINFRERRHAGASLYFALADLGLISPPPDDHLDSIVGVALFALLEGRVPPDWHVYQVPMSAYRWGLSRIAAPLIAALIIVFVAPTAMPRVAPIDIVFSTLAPAIAFLAMLRLLFAPRRWDILILLGWLQRETIIREPEACSAFVVQSSRPLTVLPHRYAYRWAASARVNVKRWGAVQVDFIDRADGQTVSLPLPRTLPNRRAIAEQIVADVAAYQARQLERSTLRAVASETLAAIDVAPSVAPSVYCVIAPRSCGAVIADTQTWLGKRGLMPAEMVWDVESGGILLPTIRGAGQCRVALFADVPAVTRSPRCRAILADLRGRGVLLIPLRVTAAQPQPSEWSSTQWVDFSPVAARERSLLGLCDALDRAGIALFPPTNAFDPEVALARGIFERTSPGWRAFIADPAVERALQRSHWRAATIYAVAVLGIFSMLGVSTIQAIQAIQSESLASPDYGYVLAAAAVLAVILAFLSIPLLRGILGQARQARLHRGILHDRNTPQCLVVTPQGIAFHLVSTPRAVKTLRAAGVLPLFSSPAGILAGGFAFHDLIAMAARRGWSGAPMLRLTTRAGKMIDLPLTSLLSTSDAATTSAIEMFAASRAPRPVVIG